MKIKTRKILVRSSAGAVAGGGLAALWAFAPIPTWAKALITAAGAGAAAAAATVLETPAEAKVEKAEEKVEEADVAKAA